MVNNDPFGNDDRTVLRPTPGGRVPQYQAPSPPPVQQYPEQSLAANSYLINANASSFLELVAPILSLAARLKVSVSYSAVDELKQKLAKQISEFETKAIGLSLPQDQVRIASYALCSFLDETIQNTPWGGQSNWGHQSLLIVFHKEAWGGERFFQMLEQLVKQPAQHLHLLELFYVLLSFGFEGKYRVMGSGLNELERQRVEIYQLIQRVKGDFAPELSPRWQGQQSGKKALMTQLPLWVFATVAAGLLLFSYLGFAFFINAASDPVYKALLALTKEPVTIAAAALPAPVPVIKGRLERFKPILRDEIAKNMVEVVDDSIIRIRNSFASGSDQIKPEFVVMLQKIAKELENDQESILVTGHTDDKPMVSARFPSNWHLSAARAKNVLTLLKTSGQLRGNARSEGRADGEPLVANDSNENRALNRRVDILIK